METIMVKIKVDEYTADRLAEFKNINKAVSDIVSNSFLKSTTAQFDSKNRKGLLDRTYAYHKRSQPNIEYTRQNFIDRYLKDATYIYLFDCYIESNFDKQLMPSFKKSPKLHDVQLMTYKEAMLLGRNATPVVFLQYGLKAEKYSSINKASRETGFDTGRVMRCLKLGISERKGSDKWFCTKKDYKKYKKKSMKVFKKSMET